MSHSPQDSQNDLLESLLGDFLDESDQLLTQLNDNLLRLDEWVRSRDEGAPDPCDASLLNEMFRAAHSIKGLSAMMGLTDINMLTHKIENVFDAARNNQLAVDRDVVDLVFMGVDQLTALVAMLQDPDAIPVNCDIVLNGIRDLLRSAGVERQQASQAEAERMLSSTTATPAPALADPFANLEDEEDVPEKYLSIFIDETETALDELNETLLALEGGGDPQDLNRLLVTAHRVKGSAASIGLNRAAKLAHLMEDLLQSLVEAGATLSGDTTDALLSCTDALRQFVSRLREGVRESAHFSQAAATLLGNGTPRPAAPSTVYAGTVHFQPDLPMAGMKAMLIHEKLARLGTICYCDPPADTLDELDDLNSFRFHLKTDLPLAEVIAQARVTGVSRTQVEPLPDQTTTPTPGSAPPRASAADIADHAAGDASGELPDTPPQSRRAAADPPPADPAAPATGAAVVSQGSVASTPCPSTRKRATDTTSRPTETVRVDIDRLDELMNLAGQLVINKAQFSQIGERLKSALNAKQSVQCLDRVTRELEKMSDSAETRLDERQLKTQLQQCMAQARRIQCDLEPVVHEIRALSKARESVKALLETIHQFDRVSNAIQQAVMDTRMVPIGPLFNRFNRVVRDIARERQKDIWLEIRGEKTELDKRMIDELSDPLTHMVRNSADHGIESPDERAAAGKPRRGTVTLEAFHRGNSIVIQVKDDGKGLDAERIVRKCVEKGLLSEADAEKMSAAQIYQMIWTPGMSTADKVTDVSGRGMGMDIVKTKIEGLNGTIDIDSTPGHGTTMTIKLPVTLAILPSLMVEINGDVFAMPMEAVTEIVCIGPRQTSTVHGQKVATVRGRVVSLVELAETLSFHRGRDARDASRETTLVIVGETGQEIGLAVDNVLGEEDVVIKSIAENYKNVSGIAGASILGDGRVSLILDIPALIDMVAKKTGLLTC